MPGVCDSAVVASRRIPDTHFQRGQVLYTPKELSEALFMLKKGRVRIYRVGPDRREFTLTMVGAGTVFGEMSLTAPRLENASRPEWWS